MKVNQSLVFFPFLFQCPWMHALPPLRVAIIGAGLAGPAAALALRRTDRDRDNVTIQIFDADADLTSRGPGGYSLTVQGNGKAALRALGALDGLLTPETCVAASHHKFTSAGVMLEGHGNKETTNGSSRFTSFLVVPRQRLREHLMSCLSGTDADVAWGRRVTDAQHSLDGLTVTLGFSDGTTWPHPFDVVVVADGIWSGVRDRLVGDRTMYLGVVAILGVAPTPLHFPAAIDGTFHTYDGRSRLFVKPFSRELSMFQLTFPVPMADLETWCSMDNAALRSAAAGIVFGWHTPCMELVVSAPLGTLRSMPMFDREPLPPPPSSTRIVFIGDACHPMCPFKGQGFNTAVADAVALGDAVRDVSREDLPRALSVFQRQCMERALPFQLGSRRNLAEQHCERALVVAAVGTPPHTVPRGRHALLVMTGEEEHDDAFLTAGAIAAGHVVVRSGSHADTDSEVWIVARPSHSAFDQTSLHTLLGVRGIRTVVIGRGPSPVVEATACDALAAGYVTVLVDCRRLPMPSGAVIMDGQDVARAWRGEVQFASQPPHDAVPRPFERPVKK